MVNEDNASPYTDGELRDIIMASSADNIPVLIAAANAPIAEAVEATAPVSDETVVVQAEVRADAPTDNEQTDEIEPFHYIDPNTGSFDVLETTARFSGALWYDKIQKLPIILAGVGGIGSWTALLLSRFNPSVIHLYDPDFVESVNMSGQLYSTEDVGNSKTDAISTTIQSFSAYNTIVSNTSRYAEDSVTGPIMIGGFDNMEARRLLFNKWMAGVRLAPKKEECLFIDARLAAEEFQVFCMTGDDIYHQNLYREKWLFDDTEAEETLCSYKQTTYCASMVASIIANLVVNFTTNQCNPLIDRDLPFLTRYDASTMFFKTES